MMKRPFSKIVLSWDLMHSTSGVFLLTTKTCFFLWNAFSVWTHTHDFQYSHKWVNEPVSGVSEHNEADRCVGSKWSEWCEWTNIASDQVALSKRSCLRLETRPPMVQQFSLCCANFALIARIWKKKHHLLPNMIPWYLFSRFHSFSFLSSVGRISNGLLGRSLRSFATFVRSHRSLAPFMGSLTHSANSLIGLLKFMDMCTRWKHVSWEQSEFLIVNRNTPLSKSLILSLTCALPFLPVCRQCFIFCCIQTFLCFTNFSKQNSRKSVRWSALPAAPKLVNVRC